MEAAKEYCLQEFEKKRKQLRSVKQRKEIRFGKEETKEETIVNGKEVKVM